MISLDNLIPLNWTLGDWSDKVPGTLHLPLPPSPLTLLTQALHPLLPLLQGIWP